VALILVGSELAGRVRWTRWRLIALFVVAATGVGSNYILLRQEAAFQRDAYTPRVRSILGGLEAAGGNTTLPGAAALSATSLAYIAPGVNEGQSAAADYLEAAGRYGGLGYSPDELVASPYSTLADHTLVTAVGMKLAPADARASSECHEVPPGANGSAVFALPQDGATVVSRTGAASVQVRRFAQTFGPEVGSLPAGQPAMLRPPSDDLTARWYVSIPGFVRICGTG
jgi:hypothetical protein